MTGIVRLVLASLTIENAVIAMIFGGLVSAVVATYRRRSPLPWLVAGALLPVISVIVLLAIKARPEHENAGVVTSRARAGRFARAS